MYLYIYSKSDIIIIMIEKIKSEKFVEMLTTSSRLSKQMELNAAIKPEFIKTLPIDESADSVYKKYRLRSRIRQYKTTASYKKNILKNKKKVIKISIIINDDLNLIENTNECLSSILDKPCKFGYEILYMGKNPIKNYANFGITYIKIDSEGFNNAHLKSAVNSAKGEYIVLINSDMRLLNGCLDVMTDILIDDNGIGVVSGKAIREDGLLDEAGSILFSDGSYKKFGSLKDINDYKYNYRRDVDCISSSCLILRKEDFLKLKNLDLKHNSVDYSILDLELNIRYFLGKRMVFDPHALVVKKNSHISGVFKEDKNRFMKKWDKEIKRDYHREGSSDLLASKYGKKKKLLIVDSIVPERDHDAGSLRMYQIIKSALDLHYDVTLFPDNLTASQPHTSELQKMGVEVVYGGSSSFDNFYTNRINYYNDIILSRPNVAIKHLIYCKLYQQNAKLIYDTVDLHYLRIRRQAEEENNNSLLKESNDWKKLETYLISETDETLVVSYEEKKLLKSSKIKADVSILSVINPRPNNLQKKEYSQREGLLFMGDYSRDPNRSAVEWFVKDIMPIIKKQIPDIKLTLIGNNQKYIERLESPNVLIKGFVEETNPYYDKARLFVCPLLYGAGVKGKIAESISYGLPVVSTSIGIEGMYLKDGVSCLEANSPEDFAAKVVEVYNNEKLWNNIREGGLKIYEKYFSEEAGRLAVKEALSE